MMGNLDLWEKVRQVPAEAKKPISGGRLNGKTDINPVWRLKTLTEQFGQCGVGWKYEITDKRLEKGENGEVAAFVDINIYMFTDKGWSAPIPGTGGSMFVAKEKSGLYTSDECFKMALTDAISVSCKALGVGADVYWEKDANKYDQRADPPPKQDAKETERKEDVITEKQRLELVGQVKSVEDKARLEEIINRYGYKSTKVIKPEHYAEIFKQYAEHNLPEVLQ